MAKLTLTMISQPNDRSLPLVDGTVQPEGFEIIHTRSDPSETFWRQLTFEEFEIAEMSLSSYLIAKEHGANMWMIPVFPSRRFFHAQLSYHVDSGIKEPGDVAGKRVGVAEYQQTASLWLRGTLEHDFGVSQYGVDWYMERTEELSHGGATGFTPPEGIKFHRIPEDKSLASMLVYHEIDVAGVGRAQGREWNLIDRSTQIRAREGDWSKIKPLFPDLMEEGTRYFKKHGFLPANHGYAIRGDIYERYPWVAFNLFKAFLEAKDVYRERLPGSIPSGLIFGPQYLRRTQQIFGEDPFPYGVKANRAMLQTAIDYSFEQGLTKTRARIEDLFAPSTAEF
jgi:4,5-dihydroxyphthalate decarboxylase